MTAMLHHLQLGTLAEWAAIAMTAAAAVKKRPPPLSSAKKPGAS